MKKSPLSIVLGVLLAAQSCPLAFADESGTAAGPGVTNYGTVNPNATTVPPTDNNPDHFPWMEKQATPPAAPTAPESFHGTPVPEPIHSNPEQSAPESKPSKKTGSAEEPVNKSKPMKLFGRIEEVTGHAGAQFPVLKAMTPKMDPRGLKPLQSSAVASAYSGQVVKSFPMDYRGTWGGNLQLQVVQLDPSYYNIDAEEARRTVQALHPGSNGAVNFTFQNIGTDKVSLEPAQIMFMVPGKDTMVGDQVNQMFGAQGANSPMGAMMKQMISSMPVPVVLSFGEINTNGGTAGEMGVSGNQLQARVLKNDIRQLERGVLEQQVVTQETTWNKATGRPRTGYGESVIRFTYRGPQQMYVQAASINYSANKHFLMKVELAGYVQKGQVMQTNPLSAMPGMGGMGGMDLQKMMNPGGAGGGVPGGIPGLDPNMLKNLFGQ